MLKVWIKGTAKDALHAASARCIPLLNARSTVYRSDCLILAEVLDEYARDVYRWFGEEPAMLPGAGFAPGTLLLYRHDD